MRALHPSRGATCLQWRPGRARSSRQTLRATSIGLSPSCQTEAAHGGSHPQPFVAERPSSGIGPRSGDRWPGAGGITPGAQCPLRQDALAVVPLSRCVCPAGLPDWAIFP